MKKRNQKLLVIGVFGIAALLGISSAVMAQKQHQPQQFDRTAVLDQLNLDENARQSLEAIMDQQKTKMDELHKKMQGERYQAHLEKRELHESHKEQVKAVLNDEQFAAFEQAMWQQRHQHNGQGKGMKPRMH